MDSCFQGIYCSFVPASGWCDDGDPCTYNDECFNEECIGSMLEPCEEPKEPEPCGQTCFSIGSCKFDSDNCCKCDQGCILFADCCQDSCFTCDVCIGP